MRREIFLIDNLDRLREFLSAGAEPEETGGGAALGVGFFACEPLSGDLGIDVTVAPPFLEDSLRGRMVAGQAAPYSREALLFGDEFGFRNAQWTTLSMQRGTSGSGAAKKSSALQFPQAPFVPLGRWLMAGVHPGIFRAAARPLPEEIWPEDLAQAGSLLDAVSALFAFLQTKVLGLRPDGLVVLLETGLLARYFKALCTWKKNAGGDKSWEEYLKLDPVRQEEFVGKTVLTWMAEEGLHPRVAVVCRSPREYESLLLHLHLSLVSSPSCANVLFRL